MNISLQQALLVVDSLCCLLCRCLFRHPLPFFLFYTVVTRTQTGKSGLTALARKLQALVVGTGMGAVCITFATDEHNMQWRTDGAQDPSQQEADAMIIDDRSDDDAECDLCEIDHHTAIQPQAITTMSSPCRVSFHAVEHNEIYARADPGIPPPLVPVIGTKRRRLALSPSRELVLLRELRKEGWNKIEARLTAMETEMASLRRDTAAESEQQQPEVENGAVGDWVD